jgi:hypothetical protein
MKIPRVTDFDPDAKVPVLKSSLDNMPSIEKRKPLDQKIDRSLSPQSISNQQHKKTIVTSEQTNNNPTTVIRDVRPVSPVRPVLPVPPKRVMKQRWPVDIYQDQYESLQRLALEDRMQGGVGSMSAMVREALDKLINEKNNLKK